MNELKNKISDAATEMEVILERIYVLSSDLANGYFDQDVKEKADMWKIAGVCYEHAGIKTDMMRDMVYDVKKKLMEIQEMLELTH